MHENNGAVCPSAESTHRKDQYQDRLQDTDQPDNRRVVEGNVELGKVLGAATDPRNMSSGEISRKAAADHRMISRANANSVSALSFCIACLPPVRNLQRDALADETLRD